MLKKFQTNKTVSPLAWGLGSNSFDLQGLIDKTADAIAEKEADIKAISAMIDVSVAQTQAVQKVSALAGIPVGIKDIIETAELPTQHGSVIYKNYQPKADAAIVRMVKRAGGQVAHKTVTTEHAFLQPDVTRNPYNLAHTPGGSSSGSAAAVAAGMLPFAIGTQTGGSVIRPANYCGVVGFKPSFGALPTVGTKTFSWSLDTLGLFAPTIEDMSLFWQALMANGGELTPLTTKTQNRPLRIGIAKTHIWDQALPETREAMELAAQSWQSAGHTIVELEWPKLFTRAFDAHKIVHDYEACRALAWEMDEHGDELSPVLMETLSNGLKVSRDDYHHARHIAKRARFSFAEIHAKIDVVMTPSAPGAAPHGLESTGTSVFNRLWTLLGDPCIHLPAYQTESGLPIGVQLVGRSAQDDLLLSIANRLFAQL